jgi:uncharacterized protein YvpB
MTYDDCIAAAKRGETLWLQHPRRKRVFEEHRFTGVSCYDVRTQNNEAVTLWQAVKIGMWKADERVQRVHVVVLINFDEPHRWRRNAP